MRKLENDHYYSLGRLKSIYCVDYIICFIIIFNWISILDDKGKHIFLDSIYRYFFFRRKIIGIDKIIGSKKIFIFVKNMFGE